MKDTYDKPNGKFGLVYGNVAMVDCHYLLDQILKELQKNIKKMSDPVQRYEAQLIFNTINSFVINNHINFCNQAFFLGGQISDPTSVYMQSAKELKADVAVLG